MRKYLPLLVFILLFSSESSGNWQNSGGDLQHSGYSESQPVPLDLRWKYKIGGSDISAPVIDSGILFIGSDDDNLYAIDAISGKLNWKYHALGKVYTPTAKNGMVFAASFDNYIYAFDFSGNLGWKYNTGSSTATPPVAYNNILYGGFDRYIYSIYTINGSLKWKYTTGGRVESAPAISEGDLYAGSNDDYIYALDARNKDLKWRYKTFASVSSSPSVVNGVVYAGSKDNSIYAIDSSTGELKWNKKTNDWVISSAAVFENSVYIGSNDYMIYALNSDNGDVIWKFETSGLVDSSPIVTNDMVYAGSQDGTIYALDPAKGTLMDKYAVGSGIISLALSDNTLFATSKDGYVYAFGTPVPEPTTFSTVPSISTIPVIKINPIPSKVSSEKLTISGTAEDPSGILVVTVNGMDAGTTHWTATLNLSNGTNTITIVAVNVAGNIKTEQREVTFVPSAVTQETTPIRTPGFDVIFSIIGCILAICILKSNKK
ncbi:MAG: PQQ-binding-like beta-propeller repeat protein [Candidatus Methanoperedens sp.]|nr:PQQ-binding-like beta-propeller repeat protein [Candidatus Methanoperedens sp.]